MKCRFFISKSLLIVASIFWASCSEDDSQPISIHDSSPESSSSGDTLLQSGSSNGSEPAEGTSSGAPGSSSSTPTGDISNSSAQYRLASDPSVTCNQTFHPTNNCRSMVCDYDPPIECHDEQVKLKFNKTEPLEKLDSIEDRLERCYEAIPVYGTGPCHCVGYQTIMEYTCSNGKVFPYAEDGLVYTKEEYEAKFLSSSSAKSSSSVAESSSSAAPSPLCQKMDFITRGEAFKNSLDEKLDSLAAAGETVSDSLKKCVRRSFPYEEGKYAKTQICDGDTTVNPRYQAKLDSIRKEVDKAIENCKAAEVQADSTKTPADSTDTPADTTNTPAE
ncbi:MAG: hypothetical protein J6W54_02225 [Fibrobacter sp.]|uniref:hypothetical protein n=1 Tax=Fibrobacter sp. TaxID=35828 RepID=UPI001B0AAACF|nr:hypothetical protein [Fibrobacter sp.]MBO7059902.1 hypothetical protein [Fibrobacter sp.]